MPATLDSPAAGSAWNPGISAGIPGEFRSLETIFRQENVYSSTDYLKEMSQWSGLSCEELACCRPERLALHELIVRVSAEIAVADGEEKSMYGRNCRRIAAHIYHDYVVPQLSVIAGIYTDLRQRAEPAVRRTLAESLFRPAAPPPKRRFAFFGTRRAAAAPVESAQDSEHRVVNGFRAAGLESEDALQRAVYKSAYRVLNSVLATRGRLGNDLDLLARLVCENVCNSYGSQLIGGEIGQLVDRAIEREGYIRIAPSDSPILVSLKGASAAGKSTLRPLLKQLMRDLGVDFSGYVTISPDVWRRVLLDYNSLGPARKYAGYLTSRELAVVDAKLDRYLREKADRERRTAHVVVDRFRFDSFSSEKVERVFNDTFAKYIDTMHMYFIVTPPEETVERGWQRALENGRYKAVEDYLGHCVEAYQGMPKLLFKWLASPRPDFIYAFLDNGVPKGTFPKTIASGNRDEIDIYDPLAFINIERYQKINTNARTRDSVYPAPPQMAVARNCGFLKECLRRIKRVNFVDSESGSTYARAQNYSFAIVDAETFARVLGDEQCAAVFREIAPGRVFPQT